MALSMKTQTELTAEEVKSFLIEPLEAASVVLAEGPVILDSPTGDPLRIPRIASRGDDATFKAENELIDEVDADFNEVVLLPNTLKSAKTLSRYSNELARHSVPAIGSAVQRNVVHQVVDKIDTEFLAGTATVDGSGNHGPKGLLNISGIQTADALDAHTV